MFKPTDCYREPWKESDQGLTPEQREFLKKRKAKKAHGKRR